MKVAYRKLFHAMMWGTSTRQITQRAKAATRIILHWLKNHFEEAVCGALFVPMVLIINIEVFRRYVLLSPGAYSEEIARYLFIWMLYLGIALGVKERAHIITDVLPKLPRRIDKAINIFATLCFMIFALAMVYFGYQYSYQMYRFKRPTEAMHIPIIYFSSSVGVGFLVTFIRLIGVLVEEIKEFRKK